MVSEISRVCTARSGVTGSGGIRSSVWIEPFVAWRGMATGIDIGLERLGDSIQPEVARLGGKQIMRDIWVPFVATLATGGQTLLHGDAHIGNTYVLPDDQVGFLDWQVVRRATPRSISATSCRARARSRIAGPPSASLSRTIASPSPSPRESCPHPRMFGSATGPRPRTGLPCWLVTAASDWQRPEVSLALSQRYATAFIDLDGANAIVELGEQGELP